MTTMKEYPIFSMSNSPMHLVHCRVCLNPPDLYLLWTSPSPGPTPVLVACLTVAVFLATAVLSNHMFKQIFMHASIYPIFTPNFPIVLVQCRSYGVPLRLCLLWLSPSPGPTPGLVMCVDLDSTYAACSFPLFLLPSLLDRSLPNCPMALGQQCLHCLRVCSLGWVA